MRTKGRRRHNRERRRQVKPQGNLEFTIQRQSLYLQNSPLVMHVTSIYFREKTTWVQIRVWRLQCHTLTHPEAPAPPDKGKPPLCENLFTPKGQVSQPMLSSTGKLPSWSSKHLKLTPGPFIGEMTSLALVNINRFTLESRKQFLKSNGKRKTHGDLEEAGPEKRRQGKTRVPCQETCCMRNQHGFPLWKRFLGGRKKWDWGIWNSLQVH